MSPRRQSFLALAAALFLFVALPLGVVAADAFTDVPDSNVHHNDITWLKDSGVTLGCNPPANTEFCPDANVTRAQMASFLRRLAENEVVHAATANAAPGTLLSYSVLDVDCEVLPLVTPTYAKVGDVGTFEKVDTDSVLRVTFNGRIYVADVASGNGALFELRVDDAATTAGRARMNLKTAEEGLGVVGSMTGLFPGLGAGEHVVSVWARAATGGSATNAIVDPGCWSTDSVIVEEYSALTP